MFKNLRIIFILNILFSNDIIDKNILLNKY